MKKGEEKSMLTPRRSIWRSTLPLAAVLLAVSAGPMMATAVSTAPLYDPEGMLVGEGYTSTIIREPSGVTVSLSSYSNSNFPNGGGWGGWDHR